MTWTVRRWLEERDARPMIVEAAALVDPRLVVFATIECVRPHIAQLPSAQDVLKTVEAWVEDPRLLSRRMVEEAIGVMNRDVIALGGSEWRAGPRVSPEHRSAMFATRQLAYFVIGRPAPLPWRLAAAMDEFVEHTRVGDNLGSNGFLEATQDGRATLVRFSAIVRTVIPYPSPGELIAAAPHLYVVQPSKREPLLGLQMTPKKVKGRWWNGYIEGPAADVVNSIPDPELMRRVYDVISA